MAKHVFLSYSTDDTSIATAARDHLEAQGIACWMAPRDITPGKDYGEQIINAIENAPLFLLILSESSNASTFVRHEVERAVSKGKVIIPFRIQPVQPSRGLEFFISNYQWIDGWEVPAAKSVEVLVQAIRNHLSGQAAQLLVPVSPIQSVTQNNLPHQLTRFIGRESELAAIEQLLAGQDVRLLTILGPGGMGKTRLSLAVAEHHLTDARFADGVYFVALAPLNDAQHILLMMAEALSFSFQAGNDARSPQQQLLDYLRSKQMLLLFDNFEHLLDGADLLAQILQTALQVRILVTSRERLRVPGEHLFPIQGLDYDSSGGFAGEASSAAARLFLQSARQFQPDLELSSGEVADVATICQLVGGMPLGIELAAAWVEVLSPQEIAAEIQRSLDFLEGERRGGQPHHRSVRAVFDSTWQRLEPVEQEVFARLSVFRGGFTREAAEEVTGATVRHLSALASKSLMQHHREQGRYTVHELLRQFGEEKLGAISQSVDEPYERHCTYFTTFLQRQEPRLKGREQAAAVGAIEAEIENIRTAWQWAIAQRKVEPIDISLEALWFFYITKSWLQEGKMIFGLAAEALHMEEPTGRQGVVLARILARQGSLTMDSALSIERANSGENAQVLYKRSIEILNKLGAHAETGFPLMGLGFNTFWLGNREQATPLFDEALAIFTEAHDLWQMSYAIGTKMYHSFLAGDYAQAMEYCRQGIAICEEYGYLRQLADYYQKQASIYLVQGEYEEAKNAAEKSLMTSRAAGDKMRIAWALQLSGEVAWRKDDLVSARHFAEASLALFQELGLTLLQQGSLNLMGNIASNQGDFRQARSYFYPILEANLKAGTLDTQRVAEAFTGMAVILAIEGKRAQAAELLDFVRHHSKAGHDVKDRAAKLRTEVAADVPELAEGSTRPIRVIVTELLSD